MKYQYLVVLGKGTLHAATENETACGRPVKDDDVVLIERAVGLAYKRICKKCDDIIG